MVAALALSGSQHPRISGMLAARRGGVHRGHCRVVPKPHGATPVIGRRRTLTGVHGGGRPVLLPRFDPQDLRAVCR